VESRNGDDGGCDHRYEQRAVEAFTRIVCTCMLAFQLIASVESQKQNVHDHKFGDTENPLAVPVIIPRLVHVGEGDIPVIVNACVR
jgi:hypothetical protein